MPMPPIHAGDDRRMRKPAVTLTDSLVALVTGDCWLEGLAVCNRHSADVVVQIADKQATPKYIFKLTVNAGATEFAPLPAGGFWFVGGVQAVVATTAVVDVFFLASL